MSAQLGQRTFASGPQTYLALKSDEYIRQLSIKNNWTKIRIGVLLAIDGTGDINWSDWGFGICSYPYGMLSWTCPIWYGFTPTVIANNTTLSYVAGTAPYYNCPGNISRYREGQTDSAVTSSGASAYIATNTGTPQRRSLLVLEATKSAGNLAINMWGTLATAQAQVDFTYANMLEAISGTPGALPTIAGATPLANWSPGSQTLAVTEAVTGPWDAVSVFWNKADYALEIYGVAVYRYA